jgi:hypothetical protein
MAMLAGVLLTASIAACTEEPQLLVPAGEPVIERIERDGALRERMLNQGESDRMNY